MPIEQIRGREGRSNESDLDFSALQDQLKDRWLRVAWVRDQDRALPAVAMVRAGNIYFVRDWHHRVSVARALGQLEIEAEVVVWHMRGPLPWDPPEQPSRPGLADRLAVMG